MASRTEATGLINSIHQAYGIEAVAVRHGQTYEL